MKTKVIFKKLLSSHQRESFTNYLPLNRALVNDIGKAVDRETEGTHTEIGASFLTRFNENPIVINAVASHHGDVPHESAYPILVQAADALSVNFKLLLIAMSSRRYTILLQITIPANIGIISTAPII
ncbi:MAG: HDIG domain-containing protein [Clostridia bacterium]|nr:HDIG domain-containing protein [Clostridia bacterium]